MKVGLTTGFGFVVPGFYEGGPMPMTCGHNVPVGEWCRYCGATVDEDVVSAFTIRAPALQPAAELVSSRAGYMMVDADGKFRFVEVGPDSVVTLTAKHRGTPAGSDLAAGDDEHEPVHAWFELSYSSYMVLPRSMLQSMPREWQAKFIALVEQMRETLQIDDAPGDYSVRARRDGKFVRDPYRDYDRGRRVVPMKAPTPEGAR